MNRSILSTIISLIYRPMYAVDPGVGDTGNKVEAPTPEVARGYLAEFGHSADSLKAMKDEDVVKLHGTVSANYGKRFETEFKAASEKGSKEKEAATAANKTKWEKGEHKLELAQGSRLRQSDVDSIAAIARERGLSLDEAKNLLKDREGTVAAYVDSLAEQARTSHAQWQKELREHPKLGGEKLAATQAACQRAIDRFMPADLRAKLRETGFGDHPLMVEFVYNIGSAMKEDGGIQPGGGAGGDDKGQSAADKLYPSTASTT